LKSIKNYNSVFGVSALIVFLFVLWGTIYPNNLEKYAGIAFNFTTTYFGWFYLLSVACFVFFCLFLAFSKYGQIRLGDEKPEYSFFAWISMLFSAGFGVGIVFWGVAEPLTHFASPPYDHIEPLTSESARLAMRYSFFNWGFHQWSVFAIVGLAIAYFQFRKKRNSLISETLLSSKRKNENKFLKNTVNILAVIATVTGVATSMGMGILQINGGLNQVLSIPKSTGVQITITAVLLALYLLSCITGINKGIKWLSNLNMMLVIGLMLFILFSGPTVFILESFVLAIGDYFQHFVEASFYMTPYSGNTWVHDWTVLYWAWVIAWSPFVGTFVARISKGRTIREFVIGVMMVPPFIAFVWMAIFGGSGLYFDLFENGTISEAVSNDVTLALFVLLENFPIHFLLSIISILLITIFLVTSADSATFVLGMMTTNGNLNPSNLVKIIWGVLMAAITVVLIISSGLKGLQTASLVSALPFTFILIFMSITLFKSIYMDDKRGERHQSDHLSLSQKKAQ